jgi:hypothetical protein
MVRVLRRERLLESCARLMEPLRSHVEAYRDRGEVVAREVSAALLGRPDIGELIGEGNGPMMENNHLNQVRFFGSILEGFSPELFVDTLHWVYRTYRCHGFHERYWEVMLPLWQEVMARELPTGAFETISPFYRWIIDNHNELVALSEEEASPLGEGESR